MTNNPSQTKISAALQPAEINIYLLRYCITTFDILITMYIEIQDVI